MNYYHFRPGLRSFQHKLDRDYAALEFPGGSEHRERTQQQNEAMDNALRQARIQEQRLRKARDPINWNPKKHEEWAGASKDLQVLESISRNDFQLGDPGQRAKSKDPRVASKAMHDLAREHLRESHQVDPDSIRAFIERHKAAQRKQEAVRLEAKGEESNYLARKKKVKQAAHPGTSHEHVLRAAPEPPETKPLPGVRLPSRGTGGPLQQRYPPMLPADDSRQAQDAEQSRDGSQRDDQRRQRDVGQAPTRMLGREERGSSSSSSSSGKDLWKHLLEDPSEHVL